MSSRRLEKNVFVQLITDTGKHMIMKHIFNTFIISLHVEGTIHLKGNIKSIVSNTKIDCIDQSIFNKTVFVLILESFF